MADYLEPLKAFEQKSDCSTTGTVLRVLYFVSCLRLTQ